MKKLFVPALIGLAIIPLLTGCLNLDLGGGATTRTQNPTIGQQLIDLQHAKDSGAITDADYQQEKAKLLNNK